MIKEKVLQTIRKFNLIPESSKVIVALSGGPDSVALLNVLLELKDELKISLEALHVNHMLRGEESERDEEFVRELCSRLKVPLTVKRVNVPAVSRGKNVEAVARELRYGVFREVLRERKADLVALGHTASDLVETVLLNLTKGAGLKGLRGFLPKREVFVRPLFEVKRSEVEEYLKEKGIPFVVDSSNLKTDYERNLIRLKVVPHLREINPSLEEAFLRSSEILRELEDFLSSQVEELLRKYLRGGIFRAPIKELQEIHPFLLSQLLLEAYRRVSGKSLSHRKIREIVSLLNRKGFKSFKPDEGYAVYREQDYLIIAPERERIEFSFEVRELPSRVETPSGSLTFKLNEGLPIAPLSLFRRAGIIVRSRKPGDRLSFKGFSKSLKKFLIEKRVPATVRWELPVVESEGEILYIPGLYRRYPAIDGDFVGVEFEQRAEGSDRKGKNREES